jgi:hypothetical protein
MTEAPQSALVDARKTARLFEEQLAVLATQIEESGRARRHLADRLNQAARRLRSFESPKRWSKALVDATQDFCDRAALFVLNGRVLQLEEVRGIEPSAPLATVPLASAPAFDAAVDSHDVIVALRVKGELSEPIAALLGESPETRFSLFPIAAGERVAAVLYADSAEGSVDRSALELLAVIAGLVLENRAAATVQPEGLVAISPVTSRPGLGQVVLGSHLRAQRFARVQVAQMRLYQAQAVKKGRANRDLYTSLKQNIDCDRATFRNRFLTASPKMVDYLHLEILRTLANDDRELLGPEYPGPMV